MDDSPYVLKSLQMVLRSVPGLRVSTATDGIEAVERAERKSPDLVLMDLQMPRMNGIEATKRLKRHAPNTKVLMMSVHDHETVREASRASGADQFATKSELHRTLLPRLKSLFPGLSVWT